MLLNLGAIILQDYDVKARPCGGAKCSRPECMDVQLGKILVHEYICLMVAG